LKQNLKASVCHDRVDTRGLFLASTTSCLCVDVFDNIGNVIFSTDLNVTTLYHTLLSNIVDATYVPLVSFHSDARYFHFSSNPFFLHFERFFSLHVYWSQRDLLGDTHSFLKSPDRI